MLVLYDKATLLHRTVELLNGERVAAMECPERIEVILAAFAANSNCTINTFRRDNLIVYSPRNQHTVAGLDYTAQNSSLPVLHDILAETHDAGYLGHLKTCHATWMREGAIGADGHVLPECFHVTGLSRNPRPPKDPLALPGWYSFDLSTGVCKDTWASALASAHLAVLGAQHLCQVPTAPNAERLRDVLALCRPPGHHCTTKLAGGYCYLNNAVVAVQTLRRFSPDASGNVKVAILDLDFHHGNGTQDYFYTDPKVLYVSIHGEHEYPYYTGFADEVGEGAGEGANVNLPLPSGSSAEAYLEKIDVAVERIRNFGAKYLVVSLGFDTFHTDPLGKFDLQTEHYEVIARRVRGAAGMGDMPSLILLEGGYVLEHLGENMLRFLKGWEASYPTQTPIAAPHSAKQPHC